MITVLPSLNKQDALVGARILYWTHFRGDGFPATTHFSSHYHRGAYESLCLMELASTDHDFKLDQRIGRYMTPDQIFDEASVRLVACVNGYDHEREQRRKEAMQRLAAVTPRTQQLDGSV